MNFLANHTSHRVRFFVDRLDAHVTTVPLLVRGGISILSSQTSNPAYFRFILANHLLVGREALDRMGVFSVVVPNIAVDND